MQRPSSLTLISIMLLLWASSCMLDQMGNAAGDGDSDSDTDVDGDSDLDQDLDQEDDAEPDVDEDTEPDAEEDAEPDADVVFSVVSVASSTGYTCGWLHDPRARAQKDVVIRFEGIAAGESIQRVRLGDVDMEYCTRDPQESCITDPTGTGSTGSVSLHYPAVSAEQEVELSVFTQTSSATWEGRFSYQVLDLDFDADPPTTAGVSAVSALVMGVCGAPGHEGFRCAADGLDVALAVEAAHDAGSVRLVHAAAPDVQTSTLTPWCGASGHGVLAMGRIFARRAATSSYPADIASIGVGGLRVHRYSTDLGRFDVLSEYTCESPPSPVAGVVGGDFHRAQTGEELVVLAWGRTTNTFKVHVHPTFQVTRNCNIRDNLAVALPTTVPLDGEPLAVQPAVADLNGDTYPDLAVGIFDELGEPEVVVLWGDGAGRFAAEPWTAHLSAGCGRPGQVIAADVDRDDALDLLVGCWSSTGVELFFNSGERSFEAAPAPLATGLAEGSGAALIAVGHLDPDDILDLVVASTDTGDVVVLQGVGVADGESRWREPTALRRQSIAIRAIALADLDGDGYDDIIIGGSGSSGGEVAVVWPIGQAR